MTALDDIVAVCRMQAALKTLPSSVLGTIFLRAWLYRDLEIADRDLARLDADALRTERMRRAVAQPPGRPIP